MSSPAAGTTHSESLGRKIALAGSALQSAASRFWQHRRVEELYPEYLLRLHGLIRASVPLMEAALLACKDLEERDPVAARMAEYLCEHIQEESGHDEWVLRDLAVLGWSAETVFERHPPPSIARAVGAQYYWIHHVHPVALLGYIAVVEGTPPVTASLDEVIARSDLPRASFDTLYKHAQLDIHHRDDLNELLDDLPLTEAHLSLLGVSALSTVGELTGALDELTRRADAGTQL